MWKRIKRAIRIARKNSRARRQRKRTSEILLAIFTLTNCGTLQELDITPDIMQEPRIRRQQLER